MHHQPTESTVTGGRKTVGMVSHEDEPTPHSITQDSRGFRLDRMGNWDQVPKGLEWQALDFVLRFKTNNQQSNEE